MIELGKYNTVKPVEKTSDGWLLADEEGSEVLLPHREIDENFNEENELNVFVYNDKDSSLVATLNTADAEIGEVGYMQAVSIAPFGAFLDWGIPKDILVPLREQKDDMIEDGWYLVYVYKDEISGKLTASSKINRYLETENIELKEGDAVELTIWDETKLGVNVIVNHKYSGLLFHNEIFSDLHLGDKTRGYVKNVREDGKLDVTLQSRGHLNIEPDAAYILQKLEDENGFIALNDKSDPKTIYNTLEISKKSFKRALGALYKKRQIRIEEDGIYLIPEDQESLPSSE